MRVINLSSLMQEYFNQKRMKIIRMSLGGITPDLDLGSGKKTKANISIDINREFKPNIVADVQHLPIRDSVVNSIICSHTIEHVSDLNMLISEMRRILNKNGVVVFFLPNDGSTLWWMIRPLWTLYYKKFVDKQTSPESHVHFFNYVGFKEFIVKFFQLSEIGKINLDMEIYAVCKYY